MKKRKLNQKKHQKRNAQDDDQDQKLVEVVFELIDGFLISFVLIGLNEHVKKLLEKAGLSFDDIEFINIQASSAELILSSSTADAVAIWEPNITRLLDKGLAKIVAQGDETDLRGTNGFVVRDEYIADNGDIVSEILNQYALAVKKIPNLDQQMLSKLSKALSIKEELIVPISQKYDFSVSAGNEDIDALQDTISFLVSIQNLHSEYRIANFVDNSYFNK